jgi:hypothetical protein
MSKMMVYFGVDFDSDTYGYPCDLTNEEILNLVNDRVEDIHCYTVEDFCTAFNNEYISDLGYVRVVNRN